MCRVCRGESSSHWRAAASQLVTFASAMLGEGLVGRQGLLIWGDLSICAGPPRGAKRRRSSSSARITAAVSIDTIRFRA
jgi:hypothetical protein